MWRYDSAKKTSRLNYLLEIQKQTKKVAQELLDLPTVPVDTAHVWRWWSDLNKRRQSSMAIAPLAWSDIDAYLHRNRIEPHTWELAALDRLEDCFTAAMAEKDISLVPPKSKSE